MSKLNFKDNGPIKVLNSDYIKYRDMTVNEFQQLFKLWTDHTVSDGIRRLSLRDMLRQHATNTENVCHIVNYTFCSCYDGLRFTTGCDNKGFSEYLAENPKMRQEAIDEMLYNFEHHILINVNSVALATLVEDLLVFAESEDFERLWRYHPLSKSPRPKNIGWRMRLASQLNFLPVEFCNRLWQESKQDIVAILYAYKSQLSRYPKRQTFGAQILNDFVATLNDIYLLSKMDENVQLHNIVTEGCEILQEHLPLETRAFIPRFDNLPA